MTNIEIDVCYTVYSVKDKYIIGKLWYKGNMFYFRYNQIALQEAMKNGFTMLEPFQEDEKIYSSKEMFEVFSNRIPDKKRMDAYNFYGINTYNPIEYLKITKGRLATDNISLEVVNCS